MSSYYAMDKGKYFIGDISKIVSTDVWKIISGFKPKVVHRINKGKFIMFELGSGVYTDTDGTKYNLTSGVLGIIHEKCLLNDITNVSLDTVSCRIYEFTSGFMIKNLKKRIDINKSFSILKELKE